jgi:hypothetical protein
MDLCGVVGKHGDVNFGGYDAEEDVKRSGALDFGVHKGHDRLGVRVGGEHVAEDVANGDAVWSAESIELERILSPLTSRTSAPRDRC